MELLGAVAAALVAGVLLAIGPRRDAARGLRWAGLYLGLLAFCSFVFPYLTALLRYNPREAGQVVPGVAVAAAGAVGSAALRLGVGLLEGIALTTLPRLGFARPVAVAVGTLLPALVEVVLRLDAVRTVAGVFPPLAVFDLLLPEIAPALLAGLLTSLRATRVEGG